MKLTQAMLIGLIFASSSALAETFTCESKGHTQVNSSTDTNFECWSATYRMAGWLHNWAPIQAIKVRLIERPLMGEATEREIIIPMNPSEDHGYIDAKLGRSSRILTTLAEERSTKKGWDALVEYGQSFQRPEVVKVYYIISDECMIMGPGEEGRCYFRSPQPFRPYDQDPVVALSRGQKGDPQ